ncbi:11852_t:CDS:2 [Diversispora eburnea]|uniref:11852_t:CDS:1 n=1 Tax=Diversispora eburnea TaxID=1213867 RepID=A0A9N8ZXA4_9GLOM|nr:11852_t:CDS:2 [Diversispora eburnea]
MSLSYSKKDLFESVLKDSSIIKFGYNTFENITEIASGAFGTVYRADSTNSGKHVALKNPSTEKYYLVLQYAKDGDLRTYLQKNFKSLNWEIKINMAKDITSGLQFIHDKNIVHKDLVNFGILNLVTSGEREKLINKTPKDYINIYSSAWKDDPNQRPTIKNIFDSLENIKLENIYNEYQDIQLEEANINNQPQASVDAFSRDSISITPSFTTSNWEEITENQIIKYDYNDFRNLKNIGKGSFGMIYSATLMNVNGIRTVTLKFIVITTMELFVNEVNTN